MDFARKVPVVWPHDLEPHHVVRAVEAKFMELRDVADVRTVLLVDELAKVFDSGSSGSPHTTQAQLEYEALMAVVDDYRLYEGQKRVAIISTLDTRPLLGTGGVWPPSRLVGATALCEPHNRLSGQ